MERTWNGNSIRERFDRASASAVIALATSAAVETKRVTHKVSGNLARSVHPAPADYQGASEDEQRAQTEDLLLSAEGVEVMHTPEGAVVTVGSWMPYACVEWVGRGHPGVTQGIEAIRGERTNTIVFAAFRREGL